MVTSNQRYEFVDAVQCCSDIFAWFQMRKNKKESKGSISKALIIKINRLGCGREDSIDNQFQPRHQKNSIIARKRIRIKQMIFALFILILTITYVVWMPINC